MKKLSLFKKMMLIASTAFMASSLVFIPFIQNKEVKLNKNKNFTAKNVVMKNEAKDVKYICQTMKWNEKWLEVTDIQRVSGTIDQFKEIDFSNLTVEGDSSDYELKSINVPESRLQQIFDKYIIKKFNMGDWKWVKINADWFYYTTNDNIDLKINIGKEVFDSEYIKNDKNFFIDFSVCNLKTLTITLEQHEKYSNFFGIRFGNFVGEKIILKGAKMSLDYWHNISFFERTTWAGHVDEIIFENEITGFNFCLFEIMLGNQNRRAKVIFKNTTENFDLFSANYGVKDSEYNYHTMSRVDIYIPNKSTKINLKKYKFEPEEKYSEWYWFLNERLGTNETTIHITQDAYDTIQADTTQRKRWEQAKEAANKRKVRNNNVPWYQIIEAPKPSTIKSTLVVPETTKVNVEETVDFNLTFTGESGYLINKESIKLFEKNSEGTTDKIVNNENYSLIINDVDDNPNKKVAKVTFLKPYNYNKLVFNYVIDERNIIRDSSTGVDIEVEEKLVLDLKTKNDLNEPIKKDETIEFTLTATKDFNWLDVTSGAKFILLDNEGHEINLEDYFTFAWVEESISSQNAKFILKSKVEHKELTSVNLKVVKRDNPTIETTTKTIKLFDEAQHNPDEFSFNWKNIIIIIAIIIGALLVAIIAGIIIYKNRKNNKQQ